MSTFRKPILSMTRQSGWKLAVIFGFSALLVIGLLLARANPSSAAKAAGSPTIASDKADYSPGATVTLMGAGWASGEAVHIFVNDTVGNTWSLNSNPDPTADTSGGFTYSFSLPSSFIASYSVTATGQTSGQATMTFTDTSNPCPNDNPTSWKTDNQVGTSSSPSGLTVTYTFSSFVNESSSGGIPGLIEYCVYPSSVPHDVAVDPALKGADTSAWTFSLGSSRFSFSRPGGDPSNIPLDGTTGTTMGTATWTSSLPTSQVIVLHVNDPTECAALYGAGTLTCFVLPGTPQTAKDLTVSKVATPSFTRTYTWGITKSVDKTTQTIAAGGTATFNYTVAVTHDAGTDSGWTVSGKITVSNPNSSEDIVANVTDAVDNGGTCSVTNGTGVTVPKSGLVTLDYSCTYSSAPNPGTNTATATWDKAAASTPDGSATGTASVDFSKATVTVKNGTITVVDDQANPATLGTASYTRNNPIDFTYALSFSGVGGTCTDYPNTATIKETGQTASQTVTVCVGEDLTVSKTATPSFTRTFTWGIKKSVDQTQINIAQGGSATFTYTVEVTHDAGADSGWTVNGTITVKNPNNWEPITLTGVTDSINDGGACSITSGNPTGAVPASGSVTLGYTCSYTSAPSPLTAGTNTATATWDKTAAFTPDGSANGTAGVDFSTPTTIVDGSVTVTDPNSPTNPLGTVKYTDLNNPTTFTYSHTFSGDPAGTCTSHDNTATFTTSDTHATGSSQSVTVTVCVGEDLSVSKTAAPSFTRTHNWSILKTVDPATQTIPAGKTGTFNYTVTVTETGFTDSGWTVTGQITVTNPNDWEAITADVGDVVGNGGSCTVNGGTGVSVPASSSVTLNYTCTYASAPSSINGTNTATATWDSVKFFTPSSSAQGNATFAFTTPTATVNQTITVTDSYKGPLGTATATDTPPFTMQTFTYQRTESGTPGTCTTYPNTATIVETNQTASASAKLCVAEDLTVTKDANPSFTRTYNWAIAKAVDKSEIDIASGSSATFNYSVNVTETSFTDSGWQVNGTITVTNPNNFEDITVTNITDAVSNGGSCTVAGGSNVKVPAGQSMPLSYTCVYNTPPTGSSGKNTATATWDQATASTPSGSATGSADFAFSTPTKTVNQTVNVTDSFAGPLGTATATDTQPFTSQTFTYQRTESGTPGTCKTYPNTATIVETGQSSSQTVKVCVGVDLTVSKTATPSFTRIYNWSIAKIVDKTLVKQVGGTATFNYNVTVKETGFTDSGWTVTGQITVTNPNNWEAITADVGDVVDNGGACTVIGGTNVSVPASSSKTLNYTCSYTSQPAYNVTATNTATATWNSGAFFTPDGSASGSAGFAFSTPTTTSNKTVTITDTFNGVTTTLGTLTATDTAPFTSKAYTYSHTVSVPTFGCKTYPNTAKIVETGQSASASVQVCGPVQTGALTMGYWQNKNGQGIITNGASTAGVCNSGTWLRQYAPFQDLSANATCSQVATYVYNIIKAANASGSSMNPMLKAQMLATSLDVYFSDPALGGNKIGAPAPIGGVTIDLTKICAMIEGSGGTATCSSSFENVSSAFGGATSLTVSQMLAYAASQSNAGGSTWYGNVKATQQLAKDAFDAINNQVAFSQ
jgi:hypothetical protein